MARDRQRAKQRKQRRAPSPPAREEGNGLTPDPRPIHRENVPGPVEHTGDVDEFEAALVAGAEGEVAEDPDAAEYASSGLDAEEATAASASESGSLAERHPAGAAPASGRGIGRFGGFLRASWAELQRVQWPDRRQVGQATAVVLGFLVIAGAFLGLADVIADRIVDLII